MTYADSSFIVSAYTEDANTEAALTFIKQHKPKLPFAFLHWPEIAGSFWKSHPEPEKRWELLQEDIAGGRKLYLLQVDSDRVARRAAGLMKGYCGRWNKLRSLDAMHVSAAVEAEADTFLSFDTRSYQRVLASTQKLRVWPPLTAEETAHLKQSANLS